MCLVRLCAIAFVALCSGAGATAASAQAEHVVFVKAAGCKGKSQQRTQTGFRVQGVKGVVTALHGVAGCRTIVVADDTGDVLWEALQIVRADVARDVAVVSSVSLDGAPDVGLTALGSPVARTAQDVWVYGHPYAMRTQPSKWHAHPPPVQLRHLVPPFPTVLEPLRARNSPSPASAMLRIQGDVLPGHSGAPVLSADRHLVGVVNGGLYGGTVGQGWAVPWSDIQWSSDRNAWSRIAEIDPGVLFSVDDRYVAAFPIVVSQQDSASSQLGAGWLMRTDVHITGSGSMRAVTTTTAYDSVAGGSCGLAVVVLLSSDDVILATRSSPTPACVGTATGALTPTGRTKEWSATFPDTLVARVARLGIRHVATTPGTPTTVVTVDSTTAVRLPFLRPGVTARTSAKFDGSHRVLVEAALAGDTTVRVVSRFENDNLLTAFRAQVAITVRDSTGNDLHTVTLPVVERRPKSPGRAMCTDVKSSVAIPKVVAVRGRTMNIAVVLRSQFPIITANLPGFRCVEQPFVGPVESQ